MALFDMQQSGGGWLGPQLGQGGGYQDPSIFERLKKIYQDSLTTPGTPLEPSGVAAADPLPQFPINGAAPIAMSGMMSPQGTYGYGNQSQQPPSPPQGATASLPPPMSLAPPLNAPAPPQDNSALPPNAAPTQYQPQQTPQQSGIGSVLGGIGSNLNAGFQGMARAKSPMEALGNLFGGLTTGQRMDPIGVAQQNQANTANALYQSLARDGRYSPAQAQAIAISAATNPDVAKAILPQALGPKEAPKTTTWQDSNGISRTAYYDPKSANWVDMQTGQPVQQAPGPQNNPSTTPYTTSAPPPGVDPAKWRTDEAARIADAQKELRTKAEGSLDFLPDAVRVMGNIQNGKYNQAIGPIVGSPTYNEYVRGIGGALDPTGTARTNLGSYNELNADIKRLATKNLKSQFGGRITNVEIGQNNQTFGGTQAADPQTAHNIIGERVRAAYETLQRAVDAKVMDPRSVPPEVVQQGIQMGALKPESFGMQPQQQPAGGAAPTAVNPKTGQRIMLKGNQWVPVQ